MGRTAWADPCHQQIPHSLHSCWTIPLLCRPWLLWIPRRSLAHRGSKTPQLFLHNRCGHSWRKSVLFHGMIVPSVVKLYQYVSPWSSHDGTPRMTVEYSSFPATFQFNAVINMCIASAFDDSTITVLSFSVARSTCCDSASDMLDLTWKEDNEIPLPFQDATFLRFLGDEIWSDGMVNDPSLTIQICPKNPGFPLCSYDLVMGLRSSILRIFGVVRILRASV